MRLSPAYIQAERNRIRDSVMNPGSLRSTLWNSVVFIVALILLTGVYMHHYATTSTRETSLSKALANQRDSDDVEAPPAVSSHHKPLPHPPSRVNLDDPQPPAPVNFKRKDLQRTTGKHYPKVQAPFTAIELTQEPTPPPQRNLSEVVKDIDKVEEQIEGASGFVKATWNAVKAGYINPEHEAVVPVFVTPLFHDAGELMVLLSSIDVPVRSFQFIWNSENEHMRKVLDELKIIPFGVSIHHHPENIGFSGAVNTGIRSGNETLSDPPARWFFIVNADASFPPSNLQRFAETINMGKMYDTKGLVYGPKQDHFAFVITRAAVEAVGYMDETFYPGYMEDIDYHWRVRLAGLEQAITKIKFIHKQSVNFKRPGTGNYKQMLIRCANGWEYGWMKWGHYGVGEIEKPLPPSGFKTPFNISGAPLSLWKMDPNHRECIRTAKGQFHISSSTCWYNGTTLYSHPDFPAGQQLTANLVAPHRSGALSRLKLKPKGK